MQERLWSSWGVTFHRAVSILSSEWSIYIYFFYSVRLGSIHNYMLGRACGNFWDQTLFWPPLKSHAWNFLISLAVIQKFVQMSKFFSPHGTFCSITMKIIYLEKQTVTTINLKSYRLQWQLWSDQFRGPGSEPELKYFETFIPLKAFGKQSLVQIMNNLRATGEPQASQSLPIFYVYYRPT